LKKLFKHFSFYLLTFLSWTSFLFDFCVAYWSNRAAPENAEPPLLFSFHYEIGKWMCLWADTGFD
ncbi:hypothetical protein DW690_24560, partial [Dorea longicatena]